MSLVAIIGDTMTQDTSKVSSRIIYYCPLWLYLFWSLVTVATRGRLVPCNCWVGDTMTLDTMTFDLCDHLKPFYTDYRDT